MKSKTPKKPSQKSKKLSKPLRESNGEEISNKLTLFDHVKHIRTVRDPNYYRNLSDENKKTFNHFMLLRALAMDDEAVGSMAFLYRYFDKIPSPQFYTLLVALTPSTFRWIPWIKTKVIKHSPELLTLISHHYEISKRQANEYVNVLLSTEDGTDKLKMVCESNGLTEKEVNNLFVKKET